MRPIFEKWLEPFRDLGATTVTMRNHGRNRSPVVRRGGRPGIPVHPGPVEYETRTHHSNMDVYERAQKDDLMRRR